MRSEVKVQTQISYRTAVAFLIMTDVRHVSLQLLILAALLFIGSSASSEVAKLLHSEGPLNQTEEHEGPLNISIKPILQPKESAPQIGNYTLKNGTGRVCIRAMLGVVYMVKENKKTLFYNMERRSTVEGGYCTDKQAVLSLTFDGGCLQFAFTKDGKVTYVSMVKAVLEPQPLCKSCQSKRYEGILGKKKLFKATNGWSFRCNSAKTLKLTKDFEVKIVSLRIQAFDLPNGAFGKEYECWPDYSRRILPCILGAVVVGVILIVILVFVLKRERRGYDQL